MYDRNQRRQGAGSIGKNRVAITIMQVLVTLLFLVMVGWMIYIQWDYLVANPPIVIDFIGNFFFAQLFL